MNQPGYYRRLLKSRKGSIFHSCKGRVTVSNDRGQPSTNRPSPFWLRRSDQAVIAAFALLATSILAISWLMQGGCRGELVEYEALPPREIIFLVDINTADWPEIALLPNVGEVLAKRIVESRQSHGPFRHPDDLGRVRGIGPKILERIKPHLAPMSEQEE